jgi:hypothetical protein
VLVVVSACEMSEDKFEDDFAKFGCDAVDICMEETFGTEIDSCDVSVGAPDDCDYDPKAAQDCIKELKDPVCNQTSDEYVEVLASSCETVYDCF